MPVGDFLKKVLAESPKTILIPSSSDPNVDEVFDLLLQGARGYLVKPFTVDSLDESIVNATKGEPIADVVMNSKDRNEALVAILMMSLDSAAGIIRQSYQFETAQREVPRAMEALRRSSELAETFAKGGFEGLFPAIEKFCIDRCQGPASRLGRLRKRLRDSRD
jgi:DNA-binding NarL/FixJ family response regulator